MKGYIILEDFDKLIECKEILDGDYTIMFSGCPNGMFSGVINRVTGATCNKDDTYDFETGALISLMKMCGVDKVVRACNEAFSEDTFKTYATKYERELNTLKKDFDKVRDLKEYYKKNYEDVKEHYDKLGDRNKYLIDDINKKLEYIKEKDEEIKKLKSDKDKSWKNYQRNIQKKQDRINELNNIEEKYIELREEYDKLFEENEKLQHEYNLCLNSENALKCTVDLLNKSVAKLNKAIEGYKNDLYNTAKRCKELEEENEKLKLDCEKLQHGYIDTDILDQKKVDAAYKEAYNTTLPVWQKETLRQMYEIRKIEASKYTLPHVHEWLYRIPTKRDEMWEKIFALHKEKDVIIKVKKEDVNTFLHELENKIPEIIWASCVKIFETKYTIGDIYFELKTHDAIYFRLWKVNKLSYSSDSHVYSYRELKHIDYLPPMRWDLFKKGRVVVKVNHHNYEDFYNKCEKEIGRKPHYTCEGTFTVYYSKGTFHTRPYDEKIPYKHKVVNWEDVR